MKIIVTKKQYFLLQEQTEKPKVFTNKEEYEKALLKYKKDFLVYNWLKELESFSKVFSNPNISVYDYEAILLKKPYGNKIRKTFPNYTFAQLLEGLGNLFSAWGRNRNQINADESKKAREIYKLLGLDMSKRIGKFPILIFQGQNIELPIYSEPQEPIFKSSTPPKPIEKPKKSEPVVEPKKPENQVLKSIEVSIPERSEVIQGPSGTFIGYIGNDGKTFIPFDKTEWVAWNVDGTNILKNQGRAFRTKGSQDFTMTQSQSQITHQDLNLLNNEKALKSYIRLKYRGNILY